MVEKKNLTLKQHKFLKILSQTLKPTEAAMQAYDCKDRASASQIAYENLRKLEISMVELMDKMGLTDEEDLKDLIRLRKAKRVIGYLHQYKKDTKGGIEKMEKIEPDEVVSNEFIEVDDNQTQLKALELTYKLKGHLTTNPLIDQSKHTHFTYVWKDKNGKPSNTDKLQPAKLPKENTRLPSEK